MKLHFSLSGLGLSTMTGLHSSLTLQMILDSTQAVLANATSALPDTAIPAGCPLRPVGVFLEICPWDRGTFIPLLCGKSPLSLQFCWHRYEWRLGGSRILAEPLPLLQPPFHPQQTPCSLPTLSHLVLPVPGPTARLPWWSLLSNCCHWTFAIAARPHPMTHYICNRCEACCFAGMCVLVTQQPNMIGLVVSQGSYGNDTSLTFKIFCICSILSNTEQQPLPCHFYSTSHCMNCFIILIASCLWFIAFVPNPWI